MPAVAPPTIDLMPDPPTTSDAASFDARADATVEAQQNLVPQMNAATANVYANALAAAASAAASEASADASELSAVSAAANAMAAAAAAGAIAWVSGTTYAIGDRRWSPINQQLYARRTVGAGTTDPSLDGTNWARIFAEPEMVTAESFFMANL